MWRAVWKTAVKHGREILEKYIPKKKNVAEVWGNLEREQKNVGRVLSETNKISQRLLGRSESILGRFLACRASGTTESKTLVSELRKKFLMHTCSGSYALYGTVYGTRHAGRLSRLALVSMCLAGGAQHWQSMQQEDLRGADTDYIKVCFKHRQECGLNQSGEFDCNNTSSISDYTVGDLIAKGSNAVVYEARKAGEVDVDFPTNPTTTESYDKSSLNTSFEVISENMSKSISSDSGSSIEIIDSTDDTTTFSPIYTDPPIVLSSETSHVLDNEAHLVEEYAGMFDLAIKMMFNYDIESRAMPLFYHMQKELLPLNMLEPSVEEGNIWHNRNHVKKKYLPPHPNIVVMQEAFTDNVPALSSSMDEYPDALPKRLNSQGYGRNKTMFIVMKRYDCTLEHYIQQNIPSVQEGCILLAQLLEAVIHMNKHDVAHRDIKSNNLLLDQFRTSDWPLLVVSDFGCCTTEGLTIPFQTEEVNRGGNPLLMAPEIARALPGRFSYLDYSKADLWAVGTVAYEIFGGENPFYPDIYHNFYLDTQNYLTAEIPDLPDHVPSYLNRIVHLILNTNPNERPEAAVVCDMIHFVLWCPEQWRENLVVGSNRPSELDLRRWTLILAAKAILLNRVDVSGSKVEQRLREQFLSHLDLHRLSEAVDMLWK